MPLALRAPGLTWRQRAVLAVVAEYCHADKGYSTFVQQKTLAEDIGLAKSDMSSELKKLKSAGFVSQIWQQVDGARRKVFIFHKDAIEAALWERATSQGIEKSSQIEKSRFSNQEPEVSKSLTKSYQITNSELVNHEPKVSKSLTISLQNANSELVNHEPKVSKSRTPYKGELNSNLNSSPNTTGLKGNLNTNAPATNNQPAENPAALATSTTQLEGQTDLLEATGYQHPTTTDPLDALASIVTTGNRQHKPTSQSVTEEDAERARQIEAILTKYPGADT